MFALTPRFWACYSFGDMAKKEARARNVGTQQNEKVAAARLSILSNVVLVALKLTVGFSIGSVAVLSEAVHSATDLLAALIAFLAVRASDVPPDEQHPYGHGKVESVSGAIEALLILAAGVFIAVHAVQTLIAPPPAQGVGWGVAVMALSALVNTLVARRLFVVAQRTDSLALEADAHHLSVDVWTSLGVVVGLALVTLTGMPLFDPLVALIVAGFIVRTAYRLTRDAFAPLIDAGLPPAEVGSVENVLRADARVLGWHKLRSRKSGSQRHIDLHVQVDDEMSLREAHALTEDLEDRIRATLPNSEVVIHTEPFEEERRHHEEVPHR